jgi:glycosyltransferase involved in cell wall biosynthesis
LKLHDTNFMNPLVSVLVPNYNHARFLRQRMDSILAQTFRDYELIVLDDCSKDNSREVLNRYAERTPMKLVFNEKNSGSPFIQWRRGATMAAGKYLWIAESDDYADPRLLETLVGELEKNPNVGIAYCQSHFVNAAGEVAGTWEHWTEGLDKERWKRSYVNSGADEAGRFLVRRNTIVNASAVLVRKGMLLEAIEGAESMRLAGDWWTWARLLMKTNVSFVAEPLNYFRSHGNSVRDTTKKAANCEECFTVIAHICDNVPVPPEIRARTFNDIFYIWMQCVHESKFPPDRAWLRRLHADGRRIHKSATRRMAWYLFKRAVMSVGLLAATVRFVRAALGQRTDYSSLQPTVASGAKQV